ncbi:MAG: hypothetical protein U0441_10460 [Polyangiaceae bacterium]
MAESPRSPEPSATDEAPPEQAAPRATSASRTPLPVERTPAQARGRRIAFILYYIAAAYVAGVGSVQVFMQAFQRREAPELGIVTCADGLARLSAAVDRARRAASLTDGEDAALLDFRRALTPEWDDRDHIEDLCRPSASSMAALDAIEQLRYAEEHAVRREAAELAPLRRRVQGIVPAEATRPGPSPAVTVPRTDPKSP